MTIAVYRVSHIFPIATQQPIIVILYATQRWLSSVYMRVHLQVCVIGSFKLRQPFDNFCKVSVVCPYFQVFILDKHT